MKGKENRTVAALALLLFLLNLGLNHALFGDGAQPYRGSIEAGYAGIARFFSGNPNPWGWNPYVYCGLPSAFTYLPGMPYTVASMLRAMPDLDPLHAYRMVMAFMACLGPPSLFLFGAAASGSIRWSFAAALAYTFCSPSYDLFHTIDNDRGLLPVPWRLHVMVKYGEGPHNFGLMLLPLALLGVWKAVHTGGFRRIFFAALGLAAVALTHWIAALALAICCLLLMLANADRPARGAYRHWRLIAAGLLGYGLACFWLTPDFIQTVAFNWPKDAFGYKLLSRQQLTLRLIVTGVLVMRFAFWRFGNRPYLFFVTSAFFVFAGLAESHYDFGVDPIPESRRYALEMELFFVLAAAEWLRAAWTSRNGVNRFCMILASIALLARGVPQAATFARSGYDRWTLVPKEQTIEYKLARRLDEARPRGRVYVSGGLRFRLNAWFDRAQVTGTFDSGLQNRTPVDLDYRFRSLVGIQPGNEASDSLAILRALGVEYLVVHGPKSAEYYRDIKNPERFAQYPKAHDDGEDEVYRLPFRSLAHLIYPTESADPWQAGLPARYLAAIDDPDRPGLTVDWEGPSRIRIRGGIVPYRMRISLMVSFAEGWKASQSGAPVPIMSDGLGYILLLPQPGKEADIILEHGATREQIVMAAISAIVWIASLIGFAKSRRDLIR